MARIKVCLHEHVEKGSPAWESALESIELSLGLGGIQDWFRRHVSDNEFASYSGMDTVFASELSLSGSVWMESYWTITLRWTFCGGVFTWNSRGAFSSCK